MQTNASVRCSVHPFPLFLSSLAAASPQEEEEERKGSAELLTCASTSPLPTHPLHLPSFVCVGGWVGRGGLGRGLCTAPWRMFPPSSCSREERQGGEGNPLGGQDTHSHPRSSTHPPTYSFCMGMNEWVGGWVSARSSLSLSLSHVQGCFASLVPSLSYNKKEERQET